MNNNNLFIAFSIVAVASLFAAGTMETLVFAMSNENLTLHIDNTTKPNDKITAQQQQGSYGLIG